MNFSSPSNVDALRGTLFVALAEYLQKQPTRLQTMVSFLPGAISSQLKTQILTLIALSLNATWKRKGGGGPVPVSVAAGAGAGAGEQNSKLGVGGVLSRTTGAAPKEGSSDEWIMHTVAIALHAIAGYRFADLLAIETRSSRRFEEALSSVGISPAIFNVGTMDVARWLSCALAPLLPFALTLTPGNITGIHVKRGITYHRTHGVDLKLDVVYTDQARITWEKSLKEKRGNPPNPNGSVKILLFVHGGGWVTGYRQFQAVPFQVAAAQAGWIVATIDYRLAPKFPLPEQIVDVKAAINFVHRHLKLDEFLGQAKESSTTSTNSTNSTSPSSSTAQQSADPNDAFRVVVIGGGSAGGHLACTAALTQNDPHWHTEKTANGGSRKNDWKTDLHGCIDIYGVHDLLDEDGHCAHMDPERSRESFLSKVVVQKDPESDREHFQSVSPYHIVQDPKTWEGDMRSQPPPFFSVHGEYDTLVPIADARAFYDKLKMQREKYKDKQTLTRVGNRTFEIDALVEVPKAPHAFNLTLSPLTYALDDASIIFMEHCARRAVYASGENVHPTKSAL